MGGSPGASATRAGTAPLRPYARMRTEPAHATENCLFHGLIHAPITSRPFRGKRKAGGNSRRLWPWGAENGSRAYCVQKWVAEVAAPGSQGLSDVDEEATMSAFRKPAEHRHPGADKEARVKSDCNEYAKVWGMR